MHPSALGQELTTLCDTCPPCLCLQLLRDVPLCYCSPLEAMLRDAAECGSPGSYLLRPLLEHYTAPGRTLGVSVAVVRCRGPLPCAAACPTEPAGAAAAHAVAYSRSEAPPPPLLQAEEREQLEEHLSGVVFARQAGRHSATRYMRLPRLDAALPRWRPVSRSCKPTSLVPLATPCRYMTVFFGDLQRTSPGAAAVAVASPAGLEALTAATQFCSGLLPEDDTWVGVILVGGQHVLSVADADICQEPEVRAMVRSSWLVGWLVAPACRPTLPCCSTLACPPLTPPLFRPLPAALTGRRSCRAPPCVRSCAPAQSGCAGWASGMA